MGLEALRLVQASLTVESFERQFREHFSSFQKRLPCRVQVLRQVNRIYVTNEERGESFEHVMNYDLAPFENIHLIDVEMQKRSWFPVLSRSVMRTIPFTTSEREQMIHSGQATMEEAYSDPGRKVVAYETWTIHRIQLTKNTLTAYEEERISRVVVKLKEEEPLSQFLHKLRTGVMTAEQGWSYMLENQVSWKERP